MGPVCVNKPLQLDLKHLNYYEQIKIRFVDLGNFNEIKLVKSPASRGVGSFLVESSSGSTRNFEA